MQPRSTELKDCSLWLRNHRRDASATTPRIAIWQMDANGGATWRQPIRSRWERHHRRQSGGLQLGPQRDGDGAAGGCWLSTRGGAEGWAEAAPRRPWLLASASPFKK